jgi:hypothetical protein
LRPASIDEDPQKWQIQQLMWVLNLHSVGHNLLSNSDELQTLPSLRSLSYGFSDLQNLKQVNKTEELTTFEMHVKFFLAAIKAQ